MSELERRLRAHWQEHHVHLGEVATLAEIGTFEIAHQLCIPEDFKSYLLNINGMGTQNDWQSDNDFIEFWKLNRIKSLVEDEHPCANSPNGEQFFIFADYCFRGFDFAVRFTPEPRTTTPVYWVNWPPQQLTETFDEFIERYIAGNETIIYPG